MAYTTQIQFLRVKYPHEILSNLLYDNAKYNIKSYEACNDIRCWSLNSHERAQYLLELISGNEEMPHEKPKQHTERPPDHPPDHPDHPDNQLKTVCISNDELKKQIKDLQEQIACLACKLETNKLCKDELDCLKKDSDEWKRELGDLKCKLKLAIESCASATKQKNLFESQLRETCNRASKDYAELQKQYDELECKYKLEADSPKCKDMDKIVEENAELKKNLKESCKKIASLQQDDKLVCELQRKLKESERKNCYLQDQLSNDDHMKDVETEICELTTLIEVLRHELEHKNESIYSDNQCDQHSKEDFERIKNERDCLQSKFIELQPDLEDLANVMQEFTDLENSYKELECELEDSRVREVELLDRLKMLLCMEDEFKVLENRVCESERLLNEYQVLQKLECLRAGYQDDRIDEQKDYSVPSTPASTPCSQYSDTDDYDTDANYVADDPCQPEQIANLEISYEQEKRGYPNMKCYQ